LIFGDLKKTYRNIICNTEGMMENGNLEKRRKEWGYDMKHSLAFEASDVVIVRCDMVVCRV
jgi:hypothetical protein